MQLGIRGDKEGRLVAARWLFGCFIGTLSVFEMSGDHADDENEGASR